MSHSSLPALLIRNSLATGAQILAALDAAEGGDGTWLEHLLVSGAVDEHQLAALIAHDTRLQRCEPRPLAAVPPAAIACVPAEIAIEHRVMPLAIDADGYLSIAMVDPTDTAAIEEVRFFSGRSVLREVAGATALACALHHYYGAHTVLWPRPASRELDAPSYAIQAHG